MATPVAVYLAEGERIDYTPSGDVAAGDVIDLGTFVGIATEPITANTLGSLVVYGLIEGTKFTGEVIALGATVYWDAGTSTFTGTSGYSEATAGKCARAAASGDATVRFFLTPGSA